MEQSIKSITFNIYADSEEEAENGRRAIIKFINILGKHGAKVSGNKVAEAVNMLNKNPFITSRIIQFFK